MEPGRNLVELHISANAITTNEQLVLEVSLSNCGLKGLVPGQIGVSVDGKEIPSDQIQRDPQDASRITLPPIENIIDYMDTNQASKHTITVKVNDPDGSYETGQAVIYFLPTLDYELVLSSQGPISEGDI